MTIPLMSTRWIAPAGWPSSMNRRPAAADPMRKATVREVLIAQMREEIEAEPDPPPDEAEPEGISLRELEEIIDADTWRTAEAP